MLFLSIPALGLIALCFFIAYRFILYPAFLSPLSSIPNAHWTSPFSPLWILWTRYRCFENRSVHAAHLKYGSVIRLAPNELSINDVDGLRTVYAGGFEKGEWYSIFDNYGSVPCMFSAWHSRPHSARKRMISNVYSKSVLHSSPALARQAQAILYDRLLPILILASASNASTGIDIHEIWNSTTMDFITAYQFGLQNGSNFLQREAERRRWFSLYHSRKTYTFFNQELPQLTKFFKLLGIHLCPTWVDEPNRELEAWCKERCDATTASMNQTGKDSDVGNQPVVMEAMFAGIAKETKTKGDESVLNSTTLQYPELSIASEMIDHLAAGHETSGITLTYISWNLSRDLALQDKLRKELLTLCPNMLLASPTSTKSICNPKDLDSLPVLHAVIMETLRLHAAIPGSQPRVTPHPSCALGPYEDIPGGVRVQAQGHSVHRNAEVYPDPEQWDYMRWLDDENGYTEDQRKERDRWFWAFSSGGRMCVGSNFAMHEIKLVIAAVYSNFRTHIVNDDGIEQTDGYTVGPASNQLILRFEKV
ncbi:putative sterigmatocystin biosynthesis P450 monooxygenase [Lachnellula willkommii]|uniref:Putative sterigmatocystin biosynthesis P450 monooxygenase n=1 Tax=Lachnellula willkommii TaxID=215461 RepID=A0A559M7X2_9HELO|nr:putative sterigmatocystin biosynthesis P450 monooxygenase [Lachnellula willkommii]